MYATRLRLAPAVPCCLHSCLPLAPPLLDSDLALHSTHKQTVYRSSLADCFFASLREVDPEQAERLARAKPSHKRGMKEKLLVRAVTDAAARFL